MESYQQKLAELEQKIDKNPEDARAIAHRGETYRLMAKYEEALADFDRAIELKPEYYWAIAHRGEVYYQTKQYEKALAEFNRALELQPDYLWALAHRAVTYEFMKRYEEALIDLNRVIELKPDYVWAYAHRARTYQDMKRYEESLKDFDKAFELDETKTIIKDWQMERGLMFTFMERYAEAIPHYEKAVTQNPEDYLAWYGIVCAKTRLNGLAKTQAEIDKLRNMLLSVVTKSANSVAFYGLSGLAAIENKTDEAIEYLQKAISIDNCRADTARHDPVWLNLASDRRFQALTADNIGCG